METKNRQKKIGQIKKRCIQKTLIIAALLLASCTARVVYIGPEDYARLAERLEKCTEERVNLEEELFDCTNHADDLLLNCK